MLLAQPPEELRVAVEEFFPPDQQENALNIAWLESGYNAFAVHDTTDSDHPCGAGLTPTSGVPVSAERSIGYFQVNSCNFPDWEWQRLYNARHNAGTAHLIYYTQGWSAWYFSAKLLGLIS